MVGEKGLVEMKVIERIAEHYDTQEVEFGRTYTWCPESVVLECSKCGKKMTLTRSDLILTQPECECGPCHTARAREEVVIQLVDEEYEAHHHPWHYDLQSQEDQHLRDEAAYPEGSPWRYNDVTSGLMGDEEECWKKARVQQLLHSSYAH
jgi:hypothetical protein